MSEWTPRADTASPIRHECRKSKIMDVRESAFYPPGTGSGFIWRLHSIARYEERDGGVYLELEAIALTREIPASLRWLVNPVVNHLSTNSLTTTLRQTRDSVNSLPADPERISLCPNLGRISSTNAQPG